MIVWFSGTGNSRYVASQLSEILSDTAVPVTEADADMFAKAGESCGLVFPIYSWGIPAPVVNFVKAIGCTDIPRDKYFWAVMTCGDETGCAPELLKTLARQRNIVFSSLFSVIMPNNYVLLPGFDVDTKEVENKKLAAAPQRIAEIADKIAGKQAVEDYVIGSWPRLKTKLIYPLFKKWGIFPSKFRSSSDCIKCGKCAKVCPMNNVRISSGSKPPVWGDKCVSCLACYHICPVHSVEYGNATSGKGQYFFPDRK